MRQLAKRMIQVVAGTVLGLVVAEAAFWLRDDGAFPHLNVYVADAALGVRLRPGATERVAFHGNPVSDVRINGRGLRGAELPPPQRDEIVVVGDSQVFGLGVQVDETFSARLAALAGRPVVNAGVPTYGPDEYVALAEELVAERKPKTVIFVANFVNDLFEARRPNRDRHAVWDGWAVRKETAPTRALDLPGRSLLFQRSHLVFALRRWLYDDEKFQGRGFSSEGSAEDLLPAASAADMEKLAARAALAARVRDVEVERFDAASKGRVVEKRLTGLVRDSFALEGYSGLDDQEKVATVFGDAGDIVYGGTDSEAGRQLWVTAELLRHGTKLRTTLEANLRKLADDPSAAKQALALLGDVDKVDAHIVALASAKIDNAQPLSPLAPAVRRLRDVCARAGCDVVVVALPVDVQVAPEEWRKYGHEPVDMSATAVLLQDLTDHATALGLRALDATAALRAAEPGAFLHHDIHMTPKGHQALATALAATLAAPPVTLLPQPELTLPFGRSPVPTPQEWSQAKARAAGGYVGARCSTATLREWTRLQCSHSKDGPTPTRIAVVEHDTGMEQQVVVTEDAAIALFATRETQRRVHVRIDWSDGKRQSVFFGEIDDPPTSYSATAYGFTAREAKVPFASATPASAQLCQCQRAVSSSATCADLVGAPSAACQESWGADCGALLACARGAMESWPRCAPGHASFGVFGACGRLCSDAVPCPSATEACVAEQGARVCRSKGAQLP